MTQIQPFVASARGCLWRIEKNHLLTDAICPAIRPGGGERDVQQLPVLLGGCATVPDEGRHVVPAQAWERIVFCEYRNISVIVSGSA
jgi:hypothetical protein